MQKVLLSVDRVSSWVGQAFSWLIVALTVLVTWEVFARYALNTPNPWAFDLMIMMYGAAFMMAGAYTLAKNGHVRGDILYGFLPPRVQAGLDVLLYLVQLADRMDVDLHAAALEKMALNAAKYPAAPSAGLPAKR